MQPMALLHKMFKKELPSIHKIRLAALMDATSTLIKVNKLTLTSLGRNLPSNVNTRSNIKRMDRLIGNSKLQQESVEFYKTMNRYLIAEYTSPWIHVDWTCICSLTQLYLLRASVSMSGRSIVIYEECHLKSKENNHPTHKAFLNKLRVILPETVKPVIVTDAGFRTPWFAYVQKIGWNFVGRLRHKNAVCLNSSTRWQLSNSFYNKATNKPTHLGHGVLTYKGQVPAHFVLYKGKSKGRHKLNHNKSHSHNARSKRYARAHKEAWVLATSLPLSTDIAIRTVKIYRQRMRIEENFRDTKCTRYGFGLKESRSRSTDRMKILLLIAAVATFACWIASIITKQNGKAATFQAHSSKFSSVLSSVYLGREALKKGLEIGVRQFINALQCLIEINAETQLEAK